jgi:hypothetical protein
MKIVSHRNILSTTLLIAIGFTGIAIAQTTGPLGLRNDVIQACADQQTGALRIVSDNTKAGDGKGDGCAPTESPVAWNVNTGTTPGTPTPVAGGTGSIRPNDVVISQISPAFIELHNNGREVVNLSTWSVQWGVGSSETVVPLSGAILPGGYYLLQTDPRRNLGLAPDDSFAAARPPAAEVGLVKSRTAVAKASQKCYVPNPSVVDYVGIELTNAPSPNTCFWGSGAARSATVSFSRNNNGCANTRDNKKDFGPVLVDPRNSFSPVVLC